MQCISRSLHWIDSFLPVWQSFSKAGLNLNDGWEEFLITVYFLSFFRLGYSYLMNIKELVMKVFGNFSFTSQAGFYFYHQLSKRDNKDLI